MSCDRRRWRCHSGQASVELLAATPVVVLVGLLAWQLAVVGHAWWRVNEAARTSARAVYVADQRGETAAGRSAARRVAKALLGDASRVKVVDGEVHVRSRVPLVWPFSAVGERSAPLISVTSRFGG